MIWRRRRTFLSRFPACRSAGSSSASATVTSPRWKCLMPTARLSKTCMAMRQSGIIDSSQPVKQKQIKMSTVLIPKRTIKTSRRRLPSTDNTLLQVERLSSGVGKKINRNTSGSTIKPENYDLIDPVLRRIFAGTFHTATSFNVQVRSEELVCLVSVTVTSWHYKN